MFEKRFLKQLYKSFKSVGGYIIGVIGFILTILSIKFQKELNLNFWLVILITLSLLLILTLFDIALYVYNASLNNSPSVLKVIKTENSTILLTEFSEYLQIQGLVTVFWLNEDYEEFVGYGEVINIQNDKKIQIDLKKNNDTENNLEAKRKALIVKPFVTTKTIE